eukprot:SAG31_NODE_39228_length_290_cov_0.544503_1_plen_30_part_01
MLNLQPARRIGRCNTVPVDLPIRGYYYVLN